MLRGLRTCVFGALAAMSWTACGDSGAADLVLRGGKVATVDSEFSIHQAVAVKDGHIVFVGSDEGAGQHIGRGTQVIELDGKLVTPGMVDAHGHPFNLGNVDEPETFSVRGSSSWAEVVERVAAKVETMEPVEGSSLAGTVLRRSGQCSLYEIRPEHLYEVSVAALKTNMQVCPHSIGPRAVRENLDIYERAFADAESPPEDVRFRIEHAELITPEDVGRFAALGVIPSVQPIHHTSDMEFLVHRLGPDRARSYASPWQALVQSGSVLAFGSDHTIYSHNPLTGFYAAITRKNEDGTPEDGYYPEQALSREEALRGYTTGPAYAAFLEDEVGSIEVGKYADLTVFDSDILTIAPAEILDTRVAYTIVDGRIVFEQAEH